MTVSEAILSRNSIRRFLDVPVPREILTNILTCVRQCGSFVNSQPWAFTVLGGEVMREWKRALWERHVAGVREEPEYYTGPMPMPEPFGARAEAFRSSIDNLIFPPGIDDRQQRQDDYVKSGVVVRDAPNAVILHMDRDMAASPLHLLAAGGVTQAVALAALERGLGTCIMGRPVESPRLLRSLTGIPENHLILCCVAVGYADPEAPINSLRPPRAPLVELATWCGFN